MTRHFGGPGRAVLALACFLILLSGAATASAADTSSRNNVAKWTRELDAPYMEDRLIAIRNLGTVTDSAFAGEFKITDRLVDVVRKPGSFPRERSAALESLVLLNRNGIRVQNILELLSEIVVADPTVVKVTPPVLVRLEALDLIVEVADQGNQIDKDRAFATLKKMWEASGSRRSRTPVPGALRAALIEAIGSFTANRDAKEILLKAMEDRTPAIRTSALRGITDYLYSTGETDKWLAKEVSQKYLALAGSPKPEDLNLRVDLLNCIEVIAANDPEAYSRNASLRTMAETRALAGPNDEARASLRVLLRFADEKLDVVDPILKGASPRNGGPKWSLDTYHDFNKALVELLQRIRASRSPSKSAKKAQAIMDHFYKLLDPRLTGPAAPPAELKISAIIGLGAVPIDFDRQEVVQRLIALLKLETETPKPSVVIVDELERSLTALTGEKAFRKTLITRSAEGGAAGAEGGGKVQISKTEVPDVEAWQAWFEANKQWLAANKDPMARPID